MTAINQKDLLNQLNTSHTTTQKSLEGVDLETVVYENPTWQIQDVVWHIAVWDRQATKSIRAFLDDSEYAIPDFNEDAFNGKAYAEGRKLNAEEILVEWNQARDEFSEIIKNFPEDKYSTDMLYPWGDERGDIVQLVDYMVEHDAEHRAEIAAAIKS